MKIVFLKHLVMAPDLLGVMPFHFLYWPTLSLDGQSDVCFTSALVCQRLYMTSCLMQAIIQTPTMYHVNARQTLNSVRRIATLLGVFIALETCQQCSLMLDGYDVPTCILDLLKNASVDS